MSFEPRIVGFFCNWCSYTGADLAGTARLTYAPSVRIIRIMCSGRIDPAFVLKAFAAGADAVLIAGCHPGDCHYIEGNYKALRRYHLLKRMLQDMGVEPERLQLEWISASEGEKVKTVVNDLVARISAMGPMNLPKRQTEWDREMEELQSAVIQQSETSAETEAAHV